MNFCFKNPHLKRKKKKFLGGGGGWGVEGPGAGLVGGGGAGVSEFSSPMNRKY